MNKQQKIDTRVKFWIALIGSGVNVWLDYKKQKAIQEIVPNYEYDYFQTLKKGLIGGAVGYGGAYLFCSIKKLFLIDYDDITPINENEYLKEVVQSYEFDGNFEGYAKAQELMDILDDAFYEELENRTEFQGSISKGTALKGISDIDIALRFSNESFDYLYQTKEEVIGFIESLNDREILSVRNQPNSIGVFCKVDGKKFKIDLIPQRLQQNGNSYSIYHTPRDNSKNPSYRKTNTKIHEHLGRYSKSKREMVMLLKANKAINKLPISGFLLERLVIDIMDENVHELSYLNRYERLKMVVDEITNSICSIKITDPANSNNVLTKRLTHNDRSKLQKHYDKISDKLEYDSRSLRYIFPLINKI